MSEDEQTDLEVATVDPPIDRRVIDRRRLTLRTFFQSGFTPRRRGGRRAEDHESLVDWHEPELLFLALAIVLLSVTDAFFTLTLLTNGAREANPIIEYVLINHPAYFAAIKMILTGGGVLILVAMARARVFKVVRVKHILQCFLATYVALIGYEVWMLRHLL
ncbi:MAG: DUF5658 family protein [Gammaproteobacteria bacterium]